VGSSENVRDETVKRTPWKGVDKPRSRASGNIKLLGDGLNEIDYRILLLALDVVSMCRLERNSRHCPKISVLVSISKAQLSDAHSDICEDVLTSIDHGQQKPACLLVQDVFVGGYLRLRADETSNHLAHQGVTIPDLCKDQLAVPSYP
jgi:hypothetical protein